MDGGLSVNVVGGGGLAGEKYGGVAVEVVVTRMASDP